MCIDLAMLSAYLDGEMEDAVRAQVGEHLAACPACRKRLDELAEVDARVKAIAVPVEDLEEKRAATLTYLESKYFNGSKLPFLKQKIDVTIGTLSGIAAAVVFLFLGAFAFISPSSEPEAVLPSYSAQADPSNLVYVSDRCQLDSFTVEEIVKYLDNKGYKVEISIKGAEPSEE